MISFKDFLILEVFKWQEFGDDDKELGIFKNPNSKEIELLKPHVRGIAMLRTGDIYIANINKTSNALHMYIGRRVKEFYGEKNFHSSPWFNISGGRSITLQRVDNTNIFAVGESESMDDVLADKAKLKQGLKKLRQKNPKLRFVAKSITELQTTFHSVT